MNKNNDIVNKNSISFIAIIFSSLSIFLEFYNLGSIFYELSILSTVFGLIFFLISINIPSLIQTKFNKESFEPTNDIKIKRLSSSHALSIASISLFALYFRHYLINFKLSDVIMMFILFVIFLFLSLISNNILKNTNSIESFDIEGFNKFKLRFNLLFFFLGLGGSLFLNFGLIIAIILTFKWSNKWIVFDQLIVKLTAILLIVNWTSFIISHYIYWQSLLFEQLFIASLLFPFLNGLVMLLIHSRLHGTGLSQLTLDNRKTLLLNMLIVFFIALLFFFLSLLLIYALLLFFPSGLDIMLLTSIVLVMLCTLSISTYISTLFRSLPIKIGLFLAANAFILAAWSLFYWSFSMTPELYSITIYFEILGSVFLFYNFIIKRAIIDIHAFRHGK